MTPHPIPHTPAGPPLNRRDMLAHSAAWAAAAGGPLTAALALTGCQAAVPQAVAGTPATQVKPGRPPVAVVPDNAASQVAHGVLGSQPFALGVASGSAGDTSVVLWTRLVAPDGDAAAWPPISVRWELAHDPGFAQLVHTGTARAQAAWAHSVHVVAQGLQPDRVYFYRFRVGDAVSAVGRTRTTPAPGAAAARWRLALASCQRWEHGLYAAWRHMQADAPDAVVFVGDYIYEYASAPTALRRVPGGAALSLADYRARYATYKTDPHLQAMHAAAPWWITWDDHEVENDYAGVQGGNTGHDSAAFMARRTAAYQAFYEHMPLRPEALTQGLAGLSTGAELRLYGVVDLGSLARLMLLDTRQYRHAQACNRLNAWGSSTLDPARCAAWLDPQRSLLGRSQEAWLAQALREGAGQGQPWLVLAQTTVMGELNRSALPQRRLWNDAWDGYAPARQRLTQHLAGLRRSHPGSVPLVLGGDVHESWVGRVLADYARPDSSAVGVELCGTSISSHSSHTAEQMAQRLANNPHFDWADTTHRGYTVLDLTPQGATALFRGLDDVREAQTPVSTLARFVVEPGRAAVHRAG